MYTTYLGIVENGALLATVPHNGLLFLLGMTLLGILSNEMGRTVVSLFTLRKDAPTVQPCALRSSELPLDIP